MTSAEQWEGPIWTSLDLGCCRQAGRDFLSCLCSTGVSLGHPPFLWGSLMDFNIRRSWLSPCISCRICHMGSSQPSEMLVGNGQVAGGQILFKKYNPQMMLCLPLPCPQGKVPDPVGFWLLKEQRFDSKSTLLKTLLPDLQATSYLVLCLDLGGKSFVCVSLSSISSRCSEHQTRSGSSLWP